MTKATDPLADLIRFARTASSFYRDLYRDLPPDTHSLSKLPLSPHGRFWEANSYENNRLLTGPIRDGIILKSGGTTGKPKFSVFSRDEWTEFTHAFSSKLASSGLVDGDRVANLFYVGELYGSFIFTHKVLEDCPVRLVQLPIAGITPLPSSIRVILEYEATVIAGLPTTLLALAEQMRARPEPRVRLILFAGEPMQEDQRERMREAFPRASIRSIGYASNDAGLLGYCDETCGINEFRCYDGEAIYEIVDENTGQPIPGAGIDGISFVTALKRRLMPIIRYPVGDRARWVDPPGAPNRKFMLLGRADDAARIASLSVTFEEVESVLRPFGDQLESYRFQLISLHHESRDGLVIRIGTSQTAPMPMGQAVLDAFYRAQPIFHAFVDQAKIHPVQIEWVPLSGLETNPRTGKLRRVIDRRAN